MSEQLSGLELRVAVGVAAGHIWKDDNDGQWKTTDRRGNHSIVDPRTWLDHYERDIATAWPLLEKWRLTDPEHRAIETSCHFVESTVYPMDRIYWTVVLSEFDEDTDEETEWQGASETDLHQDSTHALSEAICRALVAAAETD